ncbi:MAG: hypothetical protein VX768_10465 [Planctomycetota bacterium]|nr:hypothetical protein [Planctomycetota bacterium]
MLLVLAMMFVLMSVKASYVLGAPYLFWHDHPFTCILALVAVGAFLEEWVYVAVLLFTDENNPLNRRETGPEKVRGIGMLEGVRCHLGIEGSSQLASSPPATGTLSAKGETDEAKIFSTVRLIHSFATFGMIYVFSLAAAMTYQCCNENLLSAGTVNQLLGAILFALIPLIPVYPLFWVRRWILANSLALTRVFKGLSRLLARIPFFGKTMGRWFFAEVTNANNVFQTFHLIAMIKNLLGGLLLLMICVFCWSGWNGVLVQSVALTLCILVAGGTGFYGWLVYQRRRLQYEIFVLLFLTTFLLATWLRLENGTRQVRLALPPQARIPDSPQTALDEFSKAAAVQTLQRKAWKTDQQPPAEESGPHTERSILENWKQQANHSLVDSWGNPVGRTEKPILVLVCHSGGGIKAQVWSTTVLSALEQKVAKLGGSNRYINFSRHVRLVSGASGGMAGAGYWVATVADPQSLRNINQGNGPMLFHADNRAVKLPFTPESMLSSMSADCLSRVASQGFCNDLLGFPLKLAGHVFPARGEELENALMEYGPALQMEFGELAVGEQAGWRPSLIYTPTTAEDGRRFLISNLPVEYLFHSRFADEPTAQGAAPPMEQRQEGPENAAGIPPTVDRNDQESTAPYSWRLSYGQGKMKLATAIRLSGNFPVFLDAPYLPFEQASHRVHLIDAG